jgi:hypothetical protein
MGHEARGNPNAQLFAELPTGTVLDKMGRPLIPGATALVLQPHLQVKVVAVTPSVHPSHPPGSQLITFALTIAAPPRVPLNDLVVLDYDQETKAVLGEGGLLETQPAGPPRIVTP